MAENNELFDPRASAAQFRTHLEEASTGSTMNITFDFDFDSRDTTLGGSSAERRQSVWDHHSLYWLPSNNISEPKNKTNVPTSHPIISTTRSNKWWWILLIGSVALAFAWHISPTFDWTISPTTDRHFPPPSSWRISLAFDSDGLHPQADPCYNEDPVEFHIGFSPPHEINITAHKAVLNELRDSKTLEELVHTRSKVYSALEMTNKHLTSSFACAVKKFSDSPSKRAALIFLYQLTLTQTRLDSIIHEIAGLFDLYQSIAPAYYNLESAAEEELESGQLSFWQHLAVASQLEEWKWIGIDFEKIYWDPYIEKLMKWKEVESGTNALKGEIQRLEQITQVAQKVLQHLKDFGQVIMDIADKKEDKGKMMESDESKRQSTQVWFRQSIVRHIEQEGKTLTDSELDSAWEDMCCRH